MPSPRRLEGRSIAAIVCLAIVFAAEVSSLGPKELRNRARGLFVFARMAPEIGRARGTGFGFARRVGRFVLGVAQKTPPDATVALSYATDDGDVATYASSYVLVPRRVVCPARTREADFAAWFMKRPGEWVRGELANPFPEGLRASAIPFGELVRLR
jgi:hypothetical protein